jgi:ABC-type cobalamin/Fe3+-siderophores transport system ATPase subunit
MKLSAQQLSFVRAGLHIVREATLDFQATGATAIIGPNGAGKSTLVKMLAGVLAPSAGRACLEGRDLAKLAPRERAAWIGYLPQHFDPYWDLPVCELIELGAGRGGSRPAATVEQVAQRFELSPLLTHRWSSLSGGERSQVLLAMVLAVDPPVLIADEPAAALDIQHRLALVQALAARGREALCIVVMHDLDLALRFFERIVVIEQGRVAIDASAASLLSDERLDRIFHVRFERLRSTDGVVLHPSMHGPP